MSTEARLRDDIDRLFDGRRVTSITRGMFDHYMERAAALASPPPALEPSDREAELREQVIEAARRLSESEQVSGSTLPPGMPGIGGQQMTGWVRAEPLEDLLLAAYQLRAEEQRNADLRAPQPQSATLPRSGEPSDE